MQELGGRRSDSHLHVVPAGNLKLLLDTYLEAAPGLRRVLSFLCLSG